MFAACVIVTIVAVAANAFSGIAAILRFKPILPGMARAGRVRPAARPHRRATGLWKPDGGLRKDSGGRAGRSAAGERARWPGLAAPIAG